MNVKDQLKSTKYALIDRGGLLPIIGTVGIHLMGVQGGYTEVPEYDSLAHLFGCSALAYNFSAFLESKGQATYDKFKSYIIPATLAAGLLWEGYEFYAGWDISDTIDDLVLDLVGAIGGKALSRK